MLCILVSRMFESIPAVFIPLPLPPPPARGGGAFISTVCLKIILWARSGINPAHLSSCFQPCRILASFPVKSLSAVNNIKFNLVALSLEALEQLVCLHQGRSWGGGGGAINTTKPDRHIEWPWRSYQYVTKRLIYSLVKLWWSGGTIFL